MTRATVTLERDGKRNRVRFPYDPFLVESLKRVIPPKQRRYMRADAVWVVFAGLDFELWRAEVEDAGFLVVPYSARRTVRFEES